ncbi:hypothetical protein [Streptomyces boluensis]|uniref:hypothetical protein n=1 Tax=Streptomyces boluensis TaxID=1775135 RepID=UPI001FEB74CD|nr:hypothetical protein [Streptomyces boluensis]
MSEHGPDGAPRDAEQATPDLRAPGRRRAHPRTGPRPGSRPGARTGPRTGSRPGSRTGSRTGGTLAFVESPVQLLNVLEWAHAEAERSAGAAVDLTIVVLSPLDPMSRGQLRRVAQLARDEGHSVRWEEARGGASAPVKTIGALTADLRRARRVVIGDPFSRYVQLLLTITRARDLVVVDDGTATMEFIAQLARGERLVRWHRRGGRPSPRDLVFAPFARAAVRRLTPAGGTRVEVFSSMPVNETPDGVRLTPNTFAWTRARFGPPRLTKGADLVGTSLVETGVVDPARYLSAVADLARTHNATRYFAHRRESAEKLHELTARTGLEIVRPDLPLELIARRGPIGRTILSFPSTVVHTLPLALAGTEVEVAVCDIDPSWLTENASPRAEGFLSGVTGSARDVRRLPSAGSA